MIRLLRKLLPTKLAPQLRDLYEFVFIARLAMAMVILFEPIYIYRLGYGMKGVILFYLAIYVAYFFTTPLGAMFIGRYGYRTSLLLSSVATIAYYGALVAAELHISAFILAAVIFVIRNTFYWQALNFESAQDGRDDEEGREVGSRMMIELVVSALGPLIGGVILGLSGFTTLFFVVSVLVLVANVPLLLHRERHAPISFSYMDAWRRFFNRSKRQFVLGLCGWGEEVMFLILWPIYLNLFFIDELTALGGTVALTTLLGALLMLLIGGATDRFSPISILRSLTTLYSASWFVRPVAASVPVVAFLDFVGRLLRSMLTVPIMTIVYDRARHRHHVLATIALNSMSISVGKIGFLLIMLAIFTWVPVSLMWPTAFVATGLTSFLYFALR